MELCSVGDDATWYQQTWATLRTPDYFADCLLAESDEAQFACIGPRSLALDQPVPEVLAIGRDAQRAGKRTTTTQRGKLW